MPKFRVHFDTGQTCEVDAVDGTSAKTAARKELQLSKDSRGPYKDIAKIVRVEPLN